MSTASRTVGSSSVVGTVPVWPPPSPPWIITASAPQAATFSACLAAPTLGITTIPWSLSFAISSFFGASANEATLTPCLISRSTRSGASAASARRLTPNGWSVRPFTSRIACSSSSMVIVALARMPRPPAFAVPTTRRGPATQPIPVCTTGMAYAGQLGQRRPEQLLDHGSSSPAASTGGTSRSRSVFGSSISRISISSPGEGSRVIGTSPSPPDPAERSRTTTPPARPRR